ncbi:MAG: D-alanine--D-alanine ligase, partial [Alphaproteobacteria bacterium]
ARTAADAAMLDLGFPLFVKPLAEGTGKGCEKASKVRDPAALAAAVDRVTRQFAQPALVEAYLPGREFTVGIVGNGAEAGIIAVLEIVMADSAHEDVYGLLNKEECETRVRYLLADDAQARQAGTVALAAYRALGCRDAARIDIRSDARGRPHFLEANPLSGLHPTHSDLPILASLAGWSYDRLIGAIMAAACARYGLALPKAGSRRAA